MRRIELVTVAVIAVGVIAVAGLAAARLWAWTGQKSWKTLRRGAEPEFCR